MSYLDHGLIRRTIIALNYTRLRAVIGCFRYDSGKELALINSLYHGEPKLYKNFFQLVTKMKEKIRDKGKVHRKYCTSLTTYQKKQWNQNRLLTRAKIN